MLVDCLIMSDKESDENDEEVTREYILHWSYRNYEDFPEIRKITRKHAKDLYLRGNSISKVPKWISEMKNLRGLYLADNKLTELPEEISTLPFLTDLDVSDNQIAELPKSFTSLTKLIILNASKNLLKKLPDDIGRLKALDFLNIHNNQISKIPNSITDCLSLAEFNLDHNKLTSIPKSMVSMPNLKAICVAENNMFYLPAIPFPKNVRIYAQSNVNLNHISRQFDNSNNEWLRLEGSGNGHESKDVNELRNTFSADYSIISTENNCKLVIPMQVYHEGDTTLPTLLEHCFRDVERLIFTNRHTRKTNSQKLRSQLPLGVYNEFEEGPTAECLKCCISLFKVAFIRILWDERRPKLNIIEYFCSNRCLKLHKMQQTISSWPEIKWKHLEIKH